MINSILTGIFKLILTLFDKLTSPLITGLLSLFPSLSLYFTYYNNFLDSALTYVTTAKYLLLIPNAAFLFLFDYLLIKFSIYLLITGFRFVLNIYNKFKP